MMRKVVRTEGVSFLGMAIALAFSGSAYAQFSITNTNGTVGVSGYGAVPDSMGTYGTLDLTSAGNVTYTYLGSNAGWVNAFTSGNGTFVNQNGASPTVPGTSFTNLTGAGALNFSFSTLTSGYAGSASNGSPYSNGSVPSFAISSDVTVGGVNYLYILGYKDTFPYANDYNNMLVGVNYSSAGVGSGPVAAVPEPETYAMMLAGLGMIGVVSRRRTTKPIVDIGLPVS